MEFRIGKLIERFRGKSELVDSADSKKIISVEYGTEPERLFSLALDDLVLTGWDKDRRWYAKSYGEIKKERHEEDLRKFVGGIAATAHAISENH